MAIQVKDHIAKEWNQNLNEATDRLYELIHKLGYDFPHRDELIDIQRLIHPVWIGVHNRCTDAGLSG